jgi:hypothetical protein
MILIALDRWRDLSAQSEIPIGDNAINLERTILIRQLVAGPGFFLRAIASCSLTRVCGYSENNENGTTIPEIANNRKNHGLVI